MSHLANRYHIPATQLARTLTPDDLAYEIAGIIAETARTTAHRLLHESRSDDEDTAETADVQLIQLREKRDLFSRTAIAIYSRLQAERDEQEAADADAALTRMMSLQR